MVEVDDLLALQAAAQFFLDEPDDGRSLHLIGGDQREGVGEDGTIHRIGAAVAHHRQRQLVLCRLVDQGIGNAGGHGVDRPCRFTSLAFEALVTLDALGVVVFRFALFPGQGHAVDAAFLGIDVVQVIDEATVESLAVGTIGTDAVTRDGEELLGSESLRRDQGQGNRGSGNSGLETYFHVYVSFQCYKKRPVLSAGMATGAASPWRSATDGPARAARRSGRT